MSISIIIIKINTLIFLYIIIIKSDLITVISYCYYN